MSEEAAPQIEDKPVDDAAPVESGQGTTEEKPDYFSENFDPSTLPEELVPAYKQMQGAWTQKTQSLAEERKAYEQAQAMLGALQNPETAADALAALGFDLEQDDEPAPEEPGLELDPYQIQQVMSEWEQFKAQQQEQQQVQELEVLEQQLNADIQERAKHLDLSDAQHEWIFDRMLAIPPQEDGSPDVGQAVKDFEEMLSWAQERYVNSKRDAAQAPPSSPGSPSFDATDPRARAARMATILRQE